MSGSESLASFTNRTFHLSRPPGFRKAFDAAERNGRFGRIQCQRGEKSNSKGKRKRRVFLCRGTVRVIVGGKAIPASFLKIEGRGALVGAKDRRVRQTDGRIGRWSEPRSCSTSHEQERDERRGSKGDVTRGTIEKSGCISVIVGEEVRGDDPVEYFLTAGVGSTS